jgi:hypothetical protein
VRCRESYILQALGLHMVVRLSALCASRSPPPPPKKKKHFLVLISLKGWVNFRAIVQLDVLGNLKKFNDLIGTWTCNLPACSIVHQLTTLPRALLTRQYRNLDLKSERHHSFKQCISETTMCYWFWYGLKAYKETFHTIWNMTDMINMPYISVCNVCLNALVTPFAIKM